MKKLTVLLCAAVLCTTATFAQDSSTTAGHQMHGGKMKMMKDCVMMEGGKMMVMKGGKTSPMDQDMSMSNGSTVMSDGTVKMQDGTTKKLNDGDCVYMDGKIVSKMKKEGMKKGAKPENQ